MLFEVVGVGGLADISTSTHLHELSNYPRNRNHIQYPGLVRKFYKELVLHYSRSGLLNK